MERVSVEVWQQILLKVMETNDWPIFATSCTPYTFLAFMYLCIYYQRSERPNQDYLTQRRRLRLVCRAWNEFVLFTSHRWLPLEDWSPMYKLDSTTTARTNGGVGPVEKLSMLIRFSDATPIFSWASHILKRPASQSPLRAYILRLHLNRDTIPAPRDSLFDDFLFGKTTTQDLECTNTNTTLHLLSIATIALGCKVHIPISFSQISRIFPGLRSLFLYNVKVTPQQTLTLAHLEVLSVDYPSETLLESMETWDTPTLRHVSLGEFSSTPLTGVLDRFLGRWAHQIESLFCREFAPVHSSILASPLLDLPSGFWAQFPVLRLLGLDDEALKRKEWSGWSVVPPPTHPCRYLVSCFYPVRKWEVEREVVREVKDIRTRWTWHDGVRLVVGDTPTGQYYVVTNIRDGTSIANMEKTVGILPEL